MVNKNVKKKIAESKKRLQKSKTTCGIKKEDCGS